MRPLRASALLLALASCGGSQPGGGDPCLRARAEGPPAADVECPTGAERVNKIERTGPGRIPSATGRISGRGIAESVWCVTPEGADEGPYVALDGARAVIRSGAHASGQPVGAWIEWTARGAPTAVAVYGTDGALVSERLCR